EVRLVGSGWRLRDVGSTCGTYIDDRPIAAETALRDGDRVRFGEVAFYFVLSTIWLPPLPERREVGTARLPRSTATQPIQRHARETLPLQLRAPSGGGGGFVVIDGKNVQLTTAQFELVELL